MKNLKKSQVRLKSGLGLNIFLSLFFLALSSCEVDPSIMPKGDETFTLTLPKGFPYPSIPLDNVLTQNRIDLGKKLFFDPALSVDNTVSCGSCHKPEKYFSDNKALSLGVNDQKGDRNAPSLINIAYAPYLFWDGGNPTLEQQVLGPIENHKEMDFDVNGVVKRLQQDQTYVALFKLAYNRQPDVFSLTRAIACYERTLIKGNSRYDDYINGNTNAFDSSEVRGSNLFFGEKGDCFHCHTGFNLTDYSFRNNGLYETYPDSGRARITQSLQDIGKFKVPSLRDINETAPYMHDGSFNTLEQVIEHYDSGGKKTPNKSAVMRPLHLSDQDKKDLVNFLKTLTSR